MKNYINGYAKKNVAGVYSEGLFEDNFYVRDQVGHRAEKEKATDANVLFAHQSLRFDRYFVPDDIVDIRKDIRQS